MTENTNHTGNTSQTGESCGHRGHGHHRGRRMRRAAFAGTLLLAGAGLGMAGSAFSQGYGPQGGTRGENSDTGPTGGWHGPHRGGPMGGRVGGPMGGPMGGPSWEHHRRGAGMMFGPGSVERMVNRLSFVTDASSEQKQKMNAIAQRAADDLLAMREKHLAGRKQMRDVLAAPTIDRAKLESLRVEQMKLADDASKRITTAVADIADVLTPAQRAELAKRMDRFGGGR